VVAPAADDEVVAPDCVACANATIFSAAAAVIAAAVEITTFIVWFLL
jgi:hypothetical protein